MPALVPLIFQAIVLALLFAMSAYALGNRHHARGLAVGIVMSLTTFYAFAIGLGVSLPAGILQGIL